MTSSPLPMPLTSSDVNWCSREDRVGITSTLSPANSSLTDLLADIKKWSFLDANHDSSIHWQIKRRRRLPTRVNHESGRTDILQIVCCWANEQVSSHFLPSRTTLKSNFCEGDSRVQKTCAVPGEDPSRRLGSYERPPRKVRVNIQTKNKVFLNWVLCFRCLFSADCFRDKSAFCWTPSESNSGCL